MGKRTGRVVSFPGVRDPEDNHVLQVARNLSITIGSEFFGAIAKHLTRELAADCIYIGEFAGGHDERMRPLAAYVHGEPHYDDYPLAGSAAALIALGKTCICRTAAQKRFPSDELLARVGAKAYVAVPLGQAGGTPIGFMMAAYERSGADLGLVKTMLEIFAPRASGELIRLQKEDQLRESEQRYRVFIERNSDAMWRIEFEQPIPTSLPEQEQVDLIYQHGYIAECNNALARMLGYSKPEHLIGSRIDLIVPRSNPSVEQAFLRAVRSEYRFSTVEVSPVDRNGNIRHTLRTQWGIVEGGMLRRMWGSTRDITELKHSERALSASEQRMSDLLESVHLAVVILNPAGEISFCNDYFFRFTGWKPDDLVGHDWLDRLVPPDEAARLREAFADASTGSQVPLHFRKHTLRGRRDAPLDCLGRYVFAGRRWKRRGSGQYRPRYHRTETARDSIPAGPEAESIGRLASGIAHDFNNLLTIVIGYSETLLKSKTPSDAEYVGLSEIRKSAEKGAHLTRQLLAFGRRQHLRPEVLNINTLIADLQRMLRRLIGENVKLTFNLDSSSGLVYADAGQIHQVLLNLALNARDAMPEGGELTISSSDLDAGETRGENPFGLPDGKYVQLSVADTGVGMSQEVREHLFEPFFTTKEPGKGTGLGLSTVYGVVRQSGGHIDVETELNKGTCIRLFLPRSEAEPRPAPPQPRSTVLPKGTETILVVEDQEEVRALAVRIAQDLGYVVLEADNPHRAMEIARQNGQIRLVLSDVVMPGMNGYEP